MIQDHNNGVRTVAENSYIHVRHPTFFKNPTNWITQVEAAFELANVSNQCTQYFHVLTSLPPDVLESISTSLDPHSPKPYDKLKQAIIKEYSMSTKQAFKRITQLKSERHLRLSRLLDELRRCHRIIRPSASLENCGMLKQQFLDLLPTVIRRHLIDHDQCSLEVLSSKADQQFLLEEESVISIEPDPQQLVKEIKELRDELNRIRFNPTTNSTNRRKICFYHEKFGNQARKCQQPCEWKNEKPTGNESEKQ